MSNLNGRVERLERRVSPDSRFLAFARAVIEYGGGDADSDAATDLAYWLEIGRRRSPPAMQGDEPDDDPV